MPRGKNYVNQGRGVSLQASTKGGGQMIVCQYGTGCNRPDCIYRHPYGRDQSSANTSQSREPCMAHLAGLCTFSASGCRKRHPPPIECERLIAKYSQVKCRFGDSCRTKGCLYMHPGDDGYEDVGSKTNAREPTYLVQQDMAVGAFPALGAGGPGLVSSSATPAALTGNWKPSPIGQQQYTYQDRYSGQGISAQQYDASVQHAYGQGYGYAGQYGGQGQMLGAAGSTQASARTFDHQQQRSQCEAGCGPLAGNKATNDEEFPPLSSS